MKRKKTGKIQHRLWILAGILVMTLVSSLVRPIKSFAAAEECGDFLITGGTYGADYTYDSEKGGLHILTDIPITIRNIDDSTYTTNYIVIESSVKKADITLAGVLIDVHSRDKAAFEIQGSTDVVITLADGSWNSLESSYGHAGIQKSDENGTLTIQGDTGELYAVGGEGGAGIGGGSGADGTYIIINGGKVSARGGDEAASIGGGKGGSCYGLILKGGEVESYGVMGIGAGKNGAHCSMLLFVGDKAFLKGDLTLKTELTIDPFVTLTIDKDASLKLADQAALTNKGTIINNGTMETEEKLDNKGTLKNYGILDGEKAEGTGDFIVTGGVEGTDYVFEHGVLYITGSGDLVIQNTDPSKATTNCIEVADGVQANLTLAGINIDVSSPYPVFEHQEGEAAFRIAAHSKGHVTINLADGTKNILKSGFMHAGLEKSGGISTGHLIINGDTGVLIAEGGHLAAGIGGMSGKVGSNIYINGGNIMASCVNQGAGIGGGNHGSGVNIYINGGTVTAKGGQFAAGIGGGSRGNGRNIVIYDGTVMATGGSSGTGIGGGSFGKGDHIVISGGQVKATAGRSGDDDKLPDIGGAYPTYESNSLIIMGKEGVVKGDFKLDRSLEIDSDVTLTIEEGAAFTIGENVTLTNKGTLYNYGNLKIEGTLKNEGVIERRGTINKGQITEECGAFTVTGGIYGVDYVFEDQALTVLTFVPITIKNTDPKTATEDSILIAEDVDADVTLAGVNIEGSTAMNLDSPALKIADDSKGNVTITIADGTDNILRGGYAHAGLEKSGGYDSGNLTILGGTGTLIAYGGRRGAGIGGGKNGDGYHIAIVDANITATGGEDSAGIGGGWQGDGCDIDIKNSALTVTGGEGGACGMGGGYLGMGSNIHIQDSRVTVTAGKRGAGIGGYKRIGCDITIERSTVSATGGVGGAGIGSAYGNGRNIIIMDSTVTAVGGEHGAGIGGGSYGSGDNIIIVNSKVDASAGEQSLITGGVGEDIGSGKDGSISGVMIINGNSGTVTGVMKLPEDLTIDENVTLTIEKNAILTVPEHVTLTNHGTIINQGKMVFYGINNNQGAIEGNGIIREKGQSGISGMASNRSNEACGDFIVMGGIRGKDYIYLGGTLFVLTEKKLAIQNADPETPTTNCIRISDGANANIILAGVNIDVSEQGKAALKLMGSYEDDVTITLADDRNNILKSGEGHAGLEKNGEYNKVTLTIKGNTGTLTAVGGAGGAGIGSGSEEYCAHITINGGIIRATGGLFGAGIGGGKKGGVKHITINGGTVGATGDLGAGIGGGYDGSSYNIVINGGFVTATGGSSGGAGIGGGSRGIGSKIIITGGNVMATGGAYGAGIGGGYCKKYTSGKDIAITGGTVTAVGGIYGAGIGGGYDGPGEDIFISDAQVTARGGDGAAGIGGGHQRSGENIVIVNSSLKAVGGNGGGEDIGCGTCCNEYVSCSSLIIDGNSAALTGYLDLGRDLTIDSNVTLIIEEDMAIHVWEDATLTNRGRIVNKGGIYYHGTGEVKNEGTITGDGDFRHVEITHNANGYYDGETE